MEYSYWFSTYDIQTLDQDFNNINFMQFLEQATSDPEALKPTYSYSFSNNQFEHLMQKNLIDFLDVFRNFFQELSTIEELINLSSFSKNCLIFLQCERLYYLHYWRFFSIDKFIENRLMSSFLRIKNLLSSFHLHCFPKLYRSKELNDLTNKNMNNMNMNDSSIKTSRKRFSLTKNDQSQYELLLKRSKDIQFLQDHISSHFEEMIKETKKVKSGILDPMGVFFKKLVHYVKNILNKNYYFLKQENDNLFGINVEKQLSDKILNDNNLHVSYLKKELEKERLFESKLKLGKSINASESPTKKQEGLFSLISDVSESIIMPKNNSLSRKNENNKLFKKFSKVQELENDERKNSGFDPRILNRKLEPKKSSEFDDTKVKKTIIDSLSNFLVAQNSSTKNNSKLFNIGENPLFDDYKSLNVRLVSNLKDLITDLGEKRKILDSNYQCIIQNNDNFMFAENKRNISSNNFEHKLDNSYNSSENKSEINSIQENSLNSQNGILKSDTIKDRNIMNTSKKLNKTLGIPFLNSEINPEDSAFSFISNFFRKSNNSNKKKRNNKKNVNNNLSTVVKNQKLNISVKDVIKIDSNTEIKEELKYIRCIEKGSISDIRDEELFENIFDNKNNNIDIANDEIEKLEKKSILKVLEEIGNDEIFKKNNFYFCNETTSTTHFFNTNTENSKGTVLIKFVKKKQFQKELSNILNVKLENPEIKKKYLEKNYIWENSFKFF